MMLRSEQGEYLTPSGHVVRLDPDDLARLPGKLSIGSHGYAQLTGAEPRTVVLLHRWLMGATKRDGQIVDHINRDQLDNRRVNLRFVSPSESTQNRRIDNPLRGAYRTRYGKYAAKVGFQGRSIHLGTYATAEAAAQAAAEFRAKHFITA